MKPTLHPSLRTPTVDISNEELERIQLLLDYHRGNLDETEAAEVARWIAEDADFRAESEDVAEWCEPVSEEWKAENAERLKRNDGFVDRLLQDYIAKLS